MPKILVVDDEEDQQELILQRFSKKDYLKGYEFLFAKNGLEGLEFIQKFLDIELVLLDINMPQMDGLTLLEEIRINHPTIQAIMLSAYGDMTNIRTAMNRGAFDFLNKPIDHKDLEITILKTLAEVARIKANAHTLHENLLLKQKSTELEMQALRAQMNPHFIFNSLSSINNFILRNEPSKASDYLIKFSQLIRLVLENSREALISLHDELEGSRLYIEVESLRFRHPFGFKLILSDELDIASIKVPPLILQPFIENAIHHGLMPKEAAGTLVISIGEQDGRLSINITDDGVGRKEITRNSQSSTIRHKSLGLTMTKERIDLFSKNLDASGEMSLHDIKDENGKGIGTEVCITMPIQYAIDSKIS